MLGTSNTEAVGCGCRKGAGLGPANRDLLGVIRPVLVLGALLVPAVVGAQEGQPTGGAGTCTRSRRSG